MKLMDELPFTLVFLRSQGDILMIKRLRPPNRGKWNGLGGHLEVGESAREGALRELMEECGIVPDRLEFRGEVVWSGFEIPPAGMYVFSAVTDQRELPACAEGELRWQPLEWVCSAPEVVSNIHIFGPFLFSKEAPRRFSFQYKDGEIAAWQSEELEARE